MSGKTQHPYHVGKPSTKLKQRPYDLLFQNKVVKVDAAPAADVWDNAAPAADVWDNAAPDDDSKKPKGRVPFKPRNTEKLRAMQEHLRGHKTRKDTGPRNFKKVWAIVQKKREALIQPELNTSSFPEKTHLTEKQIVLIDKGIIASAKEYLNEAKEYLNESIPTQIIASSVIANSLLELRHHDLLGATVNVIGSMSNFAKNVALPLIGGISTTFGQAEQVAQMLHSTASSSIPTTGYGLMLMTFLTGAVAIGAANSLLDRDKAAVEIESRNEIVSSEKLAKILHVNLRTDSIENDIIDKFLEDLKSHGDYIFFTYLTQLRTSYPYLVIQAISIYGYALVGIKKVKKTDVDRMITDIASPDLKRLFLTQDPTSSRFGHSSVPQPRSVAFPSLPIPDILTRTNSAGGKKTRKTRKTRKH